MKILTVVSGLDFENYTRRATIEAIHKLNPGMDILMFNSVLNLFKKKKTCDNIQFYFYHFWVIQKLRKYKVLTKLEYFLRYFRWKYFFRKYDVVFFIDPNQYYLLPYISNNQKLVYLVRDPSVLLNEKYYFFEKPVISRANIILCVSQNLCNYYFEKYYKHIPPNVYLWPNTVDLELWDYNKWKSFHKTKKRHVIGLGGNITYVIDINLLIFLVENLPQYDFELAGKIDLDELELKKLNHLLSLPNVQHLGFINFNQFPAKVMNWDIGIVAAKPDHEFARYLNNNKQYQYLALGKPFVSYFLNADYTEFEDLVFIANDRLDFLNKVHSAIKKSKDPSCISKGISIAENNSSDIRAQEFIRIINNA